MSPVVILGAGLAGLGCARALPGARIYEAADHPGGHAWSPVVQGVAVDQGTHINHSRDPAWLEQTCAAASGGPEATASLVSNYWHGRWVGYPVQNHLADLPLEDRRRALLDLVSARITHRDQVATDYADWCRFQYGPHITERFYAEYTAKYWRWPMRDLAVDWLPGRLLPADLERVVHGALGEQPETQTAFARFRYPAQGGFFSFFRTWYDELDIVYNARAVEIDPVRHQVVFAHGAKADYGALASSIPLRSLVGIILDAPEHIRAAAASLRNTRLYCVNVGFSRPVSPARHWFYVYDPQYDISRISVISKLAPGSIPPDLDVLQAEIYRRDDEPLDAAGLQEKGIQDLAAVLGADSRRDVAWAESFAVDPAYPVPGHGRAAAVDHITRWLAAHDIYTMGLFGRWKFAWSDAVYRDGQETGQAIRGRDASLGRIPRAQ